MMKKLLLPLLILLCATGARYGQQEACHLSEKYAPRLCAPGCGSWRIKLSNYLLRPVLNGYASSSDERVGSL
jgi:hypothetical protein